MVDSYGDGNVYRGQVLKDSEIKTIEINRYNADVERLVEAAKRALPYCDASHQTIELRAALEPFNK